MYERVVPELARVLEDSLADLAPQLRLSLCPATQPGLEPGEVGRGVSRVLAGRVVYIEAEFRVRVGGTREVGVVAEGSAVPLLLLAHHIIGTISVGTRLLVGRSWCDTDEGSRGKTALVQKLNF